MQRTQYQEKKYFFKDENKLIEVFDDGGRNYVIVTLKKLVNVKKKEELVPIQKHSPSKKLQQGDLVKVLAEEEIRITLDQKNQLKGCVFMDGMWDYCGTTQRVFKRVEKFMDERDYLMKKSNGIVLLEGAICNGTKAFGPCDRSCFFFWREEWLEKVEE
ncbi:MAG: hypothetical protein GXO74_06565 [Calditrichaeota bacterium]|nr:hypothetical protein [Calditrichota bacterium]